MYMYMYMYVCVSVCACVYVCMYVCENVVWLSVFCAVVMRLFGRVKEHRRVEREGGGREGQER